jgi:hypothetical protein
MFSDLSPTVTVHTIPCSRPLVRCEITIDFFPVINMAIRRFVWVGINKQDFTRTHQMRYHA